MFLRMIYDDKLAAAAYLVGCQRTGEAIVIDPERDVDRYEKLAAQNGLRIVAAAETHIHADFLSGAREMAERGAKIYVSDEGDADWKYQWLGSRTGGGAYCHKLLRDGDTFAVGKIELRVIHTPGHTPEHICFMVTDRGGGADRPMGVATGDFVFVGDLGRPDLLESAAGYAGKADASARTLCASVRKFLEWPDYLQLWPGHGAGSACGKALGSVPQTTVGYEKMFNPSIRAAESEQAFVEAILEGQPEPPLYFARMKRENKMGPAILAGLPSPREMSVEDLKAVAGQGGLVIDTRTWAAFRVGHVPGSLYLPHNGSFTTDAGSLVPENEPLHLLIEPSRVEEAVRDLVRIGLDQVVGWFDARKVNEYAASGGGLASTPEVNIGDAQAMLGSTKPFVLDVRRRSEFDEGHIPGAVNISHTRLASRLGEIPRDRRILVNCRSGGRSSRAVSLLRRHGYDATNVAGGMLAWEQAAQPVER